MTTPPKPPAPRRPRRHAVTGVYADQPEKAPKVAQRRSVPQDPDIAAVRPRKSAGKPAARPRTNSSAIRRQRKSQDLPTPTSPRTVRGPKPSEPQKKERKRFDLGGVSVSLRLVAVAAILGMVALNLAPIGMQWYQQEQEYRAVRAELADAKEYNQRLQDEIAAWDNDNYVANQAKTRLGYVWPGETQFNVQGLPEDAQSGTQELGPAKVGSPRPWTVTLLESMVQADQPAASSELGGMVPSVDPNAVKESAEQDSAGE